MELKMEGLTKHYGSKVAQDHLSFTMTKGVYGLLGPNGAGKSTLLRMISGIIRPDSGELLVDGDPVFENPDIKSQICFLSDSPYFFQNADLKEMRDYYMTVYPAFNRKQFDSLTKIFNLDTNRRIKRSSYSAEP
mgnify:CR=1 FL=1